MGMMPDPPPIGSPALIDSSVLRDVLCGSKPDIIVDVGDERPLRLGKELALYDDDGYRDVYVPAVDMAEEGKAFEASCWTFSRSVSNVALRFCERSRSAFVFERICCSDSSCRCKS